MKLGQTLDTIDAFCNALDHVLGDMTALQELRMDTDDGDVPPYGLTRVLVRTACFLSTHQLKPTQDLLDQHNSNAVLHTHIFLTDNCLKGIDRLVEALQSGKLVLHKLYLDWYGGSSELLNSRVRVLCTVQQPTHPTRAGGALDGAPQQPADRFRYE